MAKRFTSLVLAILLFGMLFAVEVSFNTQKGTSFSPAPKMTVDVTFGLNPQIRDSDGRLVSSGSQVCINKLLNYYHSDSDNWNIVSGSTNTPPVQRANYADFLKIETHNEPTTAGSGWACKVTSSRDNCNGDYAPSRIYITKQYLGANSCGKPAGCYAQVICKGESSVSFGGSSLYNGDVKSISNAITFSSSTTGVKTLASSLKWTCFGYIEPNWYVYGSPLNTRYGVFLDTSSGHYTKTISYSSNLNFIKDQDGPALNLQSSSIVPTTLNIDEAGAWTIVLRNTGDMDAKVTSIAFSDGTTTTTTSLPLTIRAGPCPPGNRNCNRGTLTGTIKFSSAGTKNVKATINYESTTARACSEDIVKKSLNNQLIATVTVNQPAPTCSIAMDKISMYEDGTTTYTVAFQNTDSTRPAVAWAKDKTFGTLTATSTGATYTAAGAGLSSLTFVTVSASGTYNSKAFSCSAPNSLAVYPIPSCSVSDVSIYVGEDTTRTVSFANLAGASNPTLTWRQSTGSSSIFSITVGATTRNAGISGLSQGSGRIVISGTVRAGTGLARAVICNSNGIVNVNVVPAPACSASASPSTIVRGSSTSVTISGSNLGSGSHSMFIDFGDSSTGSCSISGSSGQCTILHIYSASGTKVITADSSSPSVTCTTGTVVVTPPAPSCSVTVIPGSPFSGDSANIKIDGENLGSGIHRFDVSFGDGQTTTCSIGGNSGFCQRNHVYSTSGLKTASASHNGNPTCSKTFTVKPAPTCSIAANPGDVVVGGNDYSELTLTCSNAGSACNNAAWDVDNGEITDTSTSTVKRLKVSSASSPESVSTVEVDGVYLGKQFNCKKEVTAKKTACKINPSRSNIALNEIKNFNVGCSFGEDNMNCPTMVWSYSSSVVNILTITPSANTLSAEVTGKQVGNAILKSEGSYRSTPFSCTSYIAVFEKACSMEIENDEYYMGEKVDVKITWGNYLSGANRFNVDCGNGQTKTCNRVGAAGSCTVTCRYDATSDNVTIKSEDSDQFSCGSKDIKVKNICEVHDITPKPSSEEAFKTKTGILGSCAKKCIAADRDVNGYLYVIEWRNNGRVFKIDKRSTVALELAYQILRVNPGEAPVSVDVNSLEEDVYYVGDDGNVYKNGNAIESDESCTSGSEADIAVTSADIYYYCKQSGVSNAPWYLKSIIYNYSSTGFGKIIGMEGSDKLYYSVKEEDTTRTKIYKLGPGKNEVPAKIKDETRQALNPLNIGSKLYYTRPIDSIFPSSVFYQIRGIDANPSNPASNPSSTIFTSEREKYSKGLAENTEYYFWTEYDLNSPYKGRVYAKKKGSNVDEYFYVDTYSQSLVKNPSSITADDYAVYWIEENKVKECRFANPSPLPTPGDSPYCEIKAEPAGVDSTGSRIVKWRLKVTFSGGAFTINDLACEKYSSGSWGACSVFNSGSCTIDTDHTDLFAIPGKLWADCTFNELEDNLRVTATITKNPTTKGTCTVALTQPCET